MRSLKGTATCRLTPRGIAIDLRIAGFRPRLVVIDIPFADIDELTRITYIEAASDPTIGPQSNDVHNVLKGRIARPTTLHLVHGAGATLLIRGRDLFYLITVDRTSIDAVMDIYAKSRAPLPPHDAAVPPSPSPRSGASTR